MRPKSVSASLTKNPMLLNLYEKKKIYKKFRNYTITCTTKFTLNNKIKFNYIVISKKFKFNNSVFLSVLFTKHIYSKKCIETNKILYIYYFIKKLNISFLIFAINYKIISNVFLKHLKEDLSNSYNTIFTINYTKHINQFKHLKKIKSIKKNRYKVLLKRNKSV